MEEMNNSLMMDLLSDNARLGVDDLHFVSSLGIVFFLSIVFAPIFVYGGIIPCMGEEQRTRRVSDSRNLHCSVMELGAHS